MEIKEFFQLHKSVAVAFSGGVDSAVLLLLTKHYAEKVGAYYVKSEFQPEFEYNDAVRVSKMLGIEIKVISANVLNEPDIVKNSSERCYYCKKRVFGEIIKAAEKDGFETVVDGTNASDDTDDRPGFKALGEFGVLSPLRDCGLTKADIRRIAKENGLPVADKPSYACLATRIPTGTAIAKDLLEKTEKAESALRETGFRNFRVRCEGETARLEFSAQDMELFVRKRETVKKLLSPYYGNIIIDSRERADE